MKLSISNLEKCFSSAIEKDAKYVGVKIQMEGFPKPEIIINESMNFDTKFAYYKKAYNEDLTLKAFNGIKIIGFTFGNSYTEVEVDLLGDSRTNLTFGQALDLAKIGLGMRLPQWGEDVTIRVQYPDENSKMTAPYLYVQSRYGRVPWKETMIELFSGKWEVVE